MFNAKEIIRQHLQDGIEIRRKALDACQADIARGAELLIAAVKAGGCIYLFGNGGSAADAQHIEGELTGRYMQERPAILARAITTNSTALTAIANDYGYDMVFARQLQVARAVDAVIGISTSGKSSNVLKGLEEARRRGAKTLGLTGQNPGPMQTLCDVCVAIPGAYTPHIQEMHIAVGHLWSHLVEVAVHG